MKFSESAVFENGIEVFSNELEWHKKKQNTLNRELELAHHRFLRTKRRLGCLITQDHSNLYAHNHSYPILLIKMLIDIFRETACSTRAITDVLRVQSRYIDLANPSHEGINNWLFRVGLYLYIHSERKKSVDILIVDNSVSIGSHKLFVALGVSAKIFEEKKGALSFEDVELIHMEKIKKSNYKVIRAILRLIQDKFGTIFFTISDQGGDIKKGVEQFSKENEATAIFDISHNINNILKNTWSNNEKWKMFSKLLTSAKQKLKLSSIGCLCPPKLGEKMRFLNVGKGIKWAYNVLFQRNDSKLTKEQRKTFKEVLDPFKPLQKDIASWEKDIRAFDLIQKHIKTDGLIRECPERNIRGSYQTIKEDLERNGMISPLTEQALSSVKKESDKLRPGQKVLGTSDIIESLFGKWKSIISENSMSGISRSILFLPVLLASPSDLTESNIKKALETVSTDDVELWLAEHLGESLISQRREILPIRKTVNVE